MTDLTKVHIKEIEGSAYSAEIKVGTHSFIVDEPATFEGASDLGPGPFDLLTSSLAACSIMTMRWYARQKDIPLENAEAEVSLDKKTNHFTKRITLHGDQLTVEQKEKLIEIAAKCPVHKTLVGEITIECSHQET